MSTKGTAAPTALGVLGTVAVSVVKNVPTRAVLWALVGFLLALCGVALSFALGLFFMGRGALILGYLAAIPIALPFIATGVLFVYGMQRGAARAALELEEKAGLVRFVVGQVVATLDRRTGGGLARIPVDQLDRQIRGAIDEYLSSADFTEGRGLVGWVIRRAKRAITRKLDVYLLAAYREDPSGVSGALSAEKISAVVSERLSEKLADLVMSGLNTQLWILLASVLLISSTWWFCLFALLALVTKAK